MVKDPGKFLEVNKASSRWVIYVLRAIYKKCKDCFAFFIKHLKLFFILKKKKKPTKVL